MTDNPIRFYWRQGRRIKRHVYWDDGNPDPNDGARYLFTAETADLAGHIVGVHNDWLDAGPGAPVPEEEEEG